MRWPSLSQASSPSQAIAVHLQSWAHAMGVTGGRVPADVGKCTKRLQLRRSWAVCLPLNAICWLSSAIANQILDSPVPRSQPGGVQAALLSVDRLLAYTATQVALVHRSGIPHSAATSVFQPFVSQGTFFTLKKSRGTPPIPRHTTKLTK